jgi:hypothetical protein
MLLPDTPSFLSFRILYSSGAADKTCGGFEQLVYYPQIVAGYSAAGLGILYKKIRILGQKALGSPPGRNNPVFIDAVYLSRNGRLYWCIR